MLAKDCANNDPTRCGGTYCNHFNAQGCGPDCGKCGNGKPKYPKGGTVFIGTIQEARTKGWAR